MSNQIDGSLRFDRNRRVGTPFLGQNGAARVLLTSLKLGSKRESLESERALVALSGQAKVKGSLEKAREGEASPSPADEEKTHSSSSMREARALARTIILPPTLSTQLPPLSPEVLLSHQPGHGLLLAPHSTGGRPQVSTHRPSDIWSTLTSSERAF